MEKFYYIFTPIIIFYINSFLKKKKIISNYLGNNHQKFLGEKSIPLAGGIYLIIFIILVLKDNYLTLYYFLFFLFLTGFSSDTKFISSPTKRLIIQALLTIFFVYFLNLYISETRVIFIDTLLVNLYFSIFFSCFCLIILMNGSNFIDGLNGLVLGYYLIVLIIIYNLNLFKYLNIDSNLIYYILYLIFILFIFNLFNLFYLGDSGTYLLSTFVGSILIIIYNQNQTFSPFFVVLLLWYPCFENLFSIIRKFKIKKSPTYADSNHLHQLIFYSFKKKFKTSNIISNNCSSLMINLYNLVILSLGSLNIFNTQFLTFLIILSIFIYTIIYIKLFRYKYKIIQNFKNK
jgi:UDP-N-acetylmuramyl pentapeptide phosphotransferase/UDP-N-acetylglucosamine-1-phosphate transferase